MGKFASDLSTGRQAAYYCVLFLHGQLQQALHRVTSERHAHSTMLVIPNKVCTASSLAKRFRLQASAVIQLQMWI